MLTSKPYLWLTVTLHLFNGWLACYLSFMTSFVLSKLHELKKEIVIYIFDPFNKQSSLSPWLELRNVLHYSSDAHLRFTINQFYFNKINFEWVECNLSGSWKKKSFPGLEKKPFSCVWILITKLVNIPNSLHFASRWGTSDGTIKDIRVFMHSRGPQKRSLEGRRELLGSGNLLRVLPVHQEE